MKEHIYMNNKQDKPKRTTHELVEKMNIEKGITFKYTSREKAERYLIDVNNYLRTASYRKNFQKHLKGNNVGKYINLDFAYLQELSTIDMHFRFIVSKMCSDIEHALKVKLLKTIEYDSTTNGYDIVKQFLSQNAYILGKLEATSISPFTSDLIQKYFIIQSVYNSSKHKNDNKIISYDDCPAWVLLELLTFGDFIKFYEFYYSTRTLDRVSTPVINLVKSLRNGVAHNNCILVDLAHGTARPPVEISQEIAKIETINSNQRKKKLSCRPMLEFTCLLYVYKQVVSDKVKYHRIKELKKLFFYRMKEKKGFFKDNELITSNYEFSCKIISAFFE